MDTPDVASTRHRHNRPGPGDPLAEFVEMGELLEHLARKQLHPEATMTHSFWLSEAKQAYDTFDARKTGKVVISWENG